MTVTMNVMSLCVKLSKPVSLHDIVSTTITSRLYLKFEIPYSVMRKMFAHKMKPRERAYIVRWPCFLYITAGGDG
jgi:hypothetical protein